MCKAVEEFAERLAAERIAEGRAEGEARGRREDGEAKGVTTLEIPASELPPGKTLTAAVRPLTSLGTSGRPIATEFKASGGRTA